MADYLDQLPDEERELLEQQFLDELDEPETSDPIEGEDRAGNPLDADQDGQLDVLEAPEPARITPSVRAAVRRAETAGQRSACGLTPGAELPEELEIALALRVEVNLALTGGRPIASVAGADPDVVAIEAPYRKPRITPDPEIEQLPSGELDDPTPEKE
jgi:hypothetical protein